MAQYLTSGSGGEGEPDGAAPSSPAVESVVEMELGLEDTAQLGGASNEMGDNLPFVSLGDGVTVTDLQSSKFFSCALLRSMGREVLASNMTELGLSASEASRLVDDLCPA